MSIYYNYYKQPMDPGVKSTSTRSKISQRQTKRAAANRRSIDKDIDYNDGKHHYAVVLRNLGRNQLEVQLTNGQTVTAVFGGKFRKKIWFNKGDFITVIKESDAECEVVCKNNSIVRREEAENAMMKIDGGQNDIFAREMQSSDDEDDMKISSIMSKIDEDEEEDSEKKTGSKMSTKGMLEKKTKQKTRTLERKNNTKGNYSDFGLSVITEKTSHSTKEDIVDDDFINSL